MMKTKSQFKKLVLKKDEERRILAGHLWIFSNEVDSQKSPTKELEPGELVQIFSQRNKFLGIAYTNPNSLILARILTRKMTADIDVLIRRRIEQALNLRTRLYDHCYYRLFYSEADGIPGLVVDRYDDTLVIQINTAGAEAMQATILEALKQVPGIKAMILKNDSQSRLLENLSLFVEVVHGEVLDKYKVIEGNTEFEIDILQGQKTGWFYDQCSNRNIMLQFSAKAKVLDLFSYVGAWGIQAAKSDAESVTCVDQSKSAIEKLVTNAKLNNVADKVDVVCEDVFDYLKRMQDLVTRYDLVILDPPALIKRKKDLKPGTQAYFQLNEMALRMLVPGGILVTASCSYHFKAEEMLSVIVKAAKKSGLRLQILARGFQSMDHPVLAAMPETAYLKAFFIRVLPN